MANYTEQSCKEALSISPFLAVEMKHRLHTVPAVFDIKRDKRESYSPGSPTDRQGRSGS